MKVAVVGSGVSGLAATWLLNEHSDHEVHLFEADSRPGGHANTVTYTQPDNKAKVDVDTGFIVFNPDTYPNFLSFLSLYPHLRDAIQPTDMTFSVSRDGGAFEWAGNTLSSVFCQIWRVLDVDMWRMLYDILRFNACARKLVIGKNAKKNEELSIGEYLEKEGYSQSFRDNYLLPMTAAIWSTPPDKCALDFPARTLIQFMNNHHLLQVFGKPSWLTLRGGSRIYIKQILSALFPKRLHLSTAIDAVSSIPDTHKILLRTSTGSTEVFDHVILACHSDTTLKMLRAGGDMTETEEQVLGAFSWNRNEAILHSDTKLMPKRREAWSCWNYLTNSGLDQKTGRQKPNVDQVALTYWMNELQHISEQEHGPILVTLNPPFEPDPEKVVGRYKYDHPVLGLEAIQAQRRIVDIQNTRGITYAGAWMNYGFHEDGFTAGLRAALLVQGNAPGSIRPPFPVRDADREPQLTGVEIIFDVLEGTGLRAMIGAMLGLWLKLCRVVVVSLWYNPDAL